MPPLTRSRNRARFFGTPFSPEALFAGGTVAGAWYDPSDLSTMFDSSAGTTQCAMPGLGSAVSVGLMLDKSQGLVLGPELVTNGDFSSGTTGWSNQNATLSVVSGQLSVVATTAFAYAYQTFTTVPGTTYKIAFDYNQSTANIARYFVGTSLGGAELIGLTTVSGVGSISRYFVATTTTTYINFGLQNSSGLQALFDTISVKALPGNHAIAFNNTARPELRARVNLLVATATLSTQSVTTQATSYTLRFAGAGSITLSGTATGSYSAGTHTITCTAGTLTLTVSGTVTTADLRPANSGALLPAYQAVVDANTYDTSGFPLYLRFDGIDDSMYTPANLNLSGTDKVAVFAGVRRNTTATMFPVELSAQASANNGAFAIGTDSGGFEYFFDSRGTALQQILIDNAAYNAPVTNVLTLSSDIAAPSLIARINSTQVGANTSSQGSGNYGTYPLYIGARNNASFFFNGHLYSLIIAGSAVSAGNISATEQWVAQRTGIVIP